ncbi:MAG: LysR family transcriptional regulator [Janthinobacterium lividum]
MIDKLELILALARERHFGRAAESVGITQPTLSAGLRQLEDQLGILIVERDSRFRGFTPEGERVLGWARRIVSDTRAMRQEIEAHRRDVAGHLRLAVIPTAVPGVALLTAPMLRRHPGLRFTVLSRTSNQVVELMDNLEVDAGVTYLDADTLRRVASVPLYREHFHLVTRGDGGFAGRDSVTWEEARGLALCLLTPDMQNRRILDRLLGQAAGGAGGTPVARLESNSVLALLSHVRGGGWASVLPGAVVRAMAGGAPEGGQDDAVAFRAAGLCSVPLVEPHTSYEVGLVVPRREALPLLTLALVAEARALGVAGA